jgi:Photoprotection regulator fluorescence recovery protein
MSVSNSEWSIMEEKVAQEAFKIAYEREIAALVKEVRDRTNSIAQINDLWNLHDFLSARRHDIDGKYDYQESALIFVFSRLLKEGWLKIHELEGLSAEKRTKIAVLSRM